MYLVILKDEAYNKMMFRFSTMEEVSVFVNTALKTSMNPMEVTISIEEVECDVEDV